MESQSPKSIKSELPRLTTKEIRNEAFRFFNLEKGLAYTYVSLFKNPFNTIRTYLRVDRKKVSNPLQYILFGVAIYTFLISFHPSFHAFLEKLYNGRSVAKMQENAVFFDAFKKAQMAFFSYQNVFYIIIIPLISLITFWLFRKMYNYAENLVIHSFIFGTSMWTSVILGILTIMIESPLIMFPILPIISYTIVTYLYKSIYQLSWLKAIGLMILIFGFTSVFSGVSQLILAIILMLT